MKSFFNVKDRQFWNYLSSYVTLVAFFELLEHHIQRQIVENEVTRILIKLAQHSQGRSVICVHESQVLDVEQRHDILTVAFVNRNARVA